MAATPQFKVYTADNVYVAALKEAWPAYQVALIYGTGSTVRVGHSKIAITIQDLIYGQRNTELSVEEVDSLVAKVL